MTDLLLRERQGIIRKRLAEEGRVIAADLAQEFRISEDTIRRDLREMAAAGFCRRVYGGALPAAGDDDGAGAQQALEQRVHFTERLSGGITSTAVHIPDRIIAARADEDHFWTRSLNLIGFR